MTENEAKGFMLIEKECINRDCNRDCIKCDIVQTIGNLNIAYDMAIKALEEVQQYRAIGTVEECRKSVEICKSMIERNITPENMEEHMKFEDECVKDGFTFNSLLESREKQTAKKPYYEGDGYSDGHLVYDTWICPCCGKHYEVDYDDYDFCPACGQCIDWSDEE